MYTVSKHFTTVTTAKQINNPAQLSCPVTVFLRCWKANLYSALKQLLFSMHWICSHSGSEETKLLHRWPCSLPDATEKSELLQTNGISSMTFPWFALWVSQRWCTHHCLLSHNLPVQQRSNLVLISHEVLLSGKRSDKKKVGPTKGEGENTG